jgi:hypothetical protein
MSDPVIVTAAEAGIEPHLTLDEFARAIGRDRRTVLNRIYSGDVAILALEPTQPIPGGAWLFLARAVKAAFERGRQRATGFRRAARVVPPVARPRRRPRHSRCCSGACVGCRRAGGERAPC